jgi:hypothetical protein
MKKYILYIINLLFAVLTAISMSAQDPNFHIYLCFGQSNMEGQGTIESQDETVNSRFQMMSALDCSNLGHQYGQWYSAIPPLARCYNGLGPADYFGRTMVENLPENITVGVINVSVGGCDIGLFDKVNYANYYTADYIESAAMEYGGSPYARLVELAQLAQQDGVIKGILFHQGETNTGQADWPNKVKAVYDNLISDLNLDPTQTPFLAGEMLYADQGGACASHNAIVANIPNVLPNSYVISAEGLPGQDEYHFNSAGYRTLGERYAQQMLQLIEINTDAPTVTIEEPSTTTFNAPASITISATATDPNGTIQRVEFYNGTTKLGESTSSPYTYSWNNVPGGTHTIRVVATDNDNNEGDNSIIINVQGSYAGTLHAIPGTIEFEEFDVGGNGVAYFDEDAGTNVSPDPNFRSDEDVDIENCDDDGGYNIGYTMAGEWLEYTVTVAQTGLYNIDFRIANETDTKTISLAFDGTTVAGNISIPATGGWQTWETVSVEDIQLTAGTHIMRLTIGDSDYVNLNNATFTAVSVVDNCPDDPNKTELGICGCGTPDIDTDGDGTMDCLDNCPNDPNKTEPGMCGCGQEEGSCEQEIDLTAGWNLVGCPLSDETNVDEAMGSIWQYVEQVKDFDTFYSVDQNPNLNTLQTVSWSKAYLVKVSQDCTLQW